MDHRQKNKITDTSSCDGFSLQGGCGFLRQVEQLSHLGGTRSRAAAPQCRGEPFEEVQARVEEPPGLLPREVFRLSQWEETSGPDPRPGGEIRSGKAFIHLIWG